MIRHITSINDLTNPEIERIFEAADGYLRKLPDRRFDYRIGSSTDDADGRILATLFYEPSTRTRLSFESAMLRLGGKTISSADPATSSVAKGESLADTVRVISNYADAIVLRHPRDGAARLAAEYSSVPIINGGDGSHEHPTQTLCDIYTLRRKNKSLKRLNIALSGDLRGSRTIHSFVYALARFGANIMLMPAKGMELPAHVDRRLRDEFQCRPVAKESHGKDTPIDALYVTSDKPHQLALIARVESDDKVNVKIRRAIDAVYVTRFQKERWAVAQDAYPRIDAKFLKGSRYARTSVLHPLPRVGELDVALDSDSRALYFQQAAFGVPIRMALIALVLGVGNEKPLARFEAGFQADKLATYRRPADVGIRCANGNCIVHDPLEQPYAQNQFELAYRPSTGKHSLRCTYCESDIDDFVSVDTAKRRVVETNAQSLAAATRKDATISFYATLADADAHGYRQGQSRRKIA